MLDTHAAIWIILGRPALSAAAAERLGSGERTVISAVSAWEIAIKRSAGKLDVPGEALDRLVRSGADRLAIDFRHAEAVEHLPRHHGDPFDRLLVAQAQIEGAAVVSADPLLRRYDVEVVW